jgi:hypothetical protein
LEWKHQPASQQTKTFLHYYASLESFLKAKWQMMRRPKRSTIRTDVYEIRPRADKHGVDLVSDALPYSPMWYRGPKAITNAIGGPVGGTSTAFVSALIFVRLIAPVLKTGRPNGLVSSNLTRSAFTCWAAGD